MKRNKSKILILSISASLLTLFLASTAVWAVNHSYEERIVESTTPRSSVTASDTYPLDIETLNKLVNEERTKAGLPVLTIDLRLNKSAQLKSDDMRLDGYYGHINPKTGKHGFSYVHEQTNNMCSYAGENLIGAFDSKTAVDGWMKSAAHKAAILDSKYTLVGYGINGDYIVQHFCDVK